MSGVEILRQCNITFQDEIHDEVDGGMVIIQGEITKGTVTISEPSRNPWQRKLVRVDQLTEASWQHIGATWRVTGRSNYLRYTVMDPDDIMTIDITPHHCKDCP